MRPLCSQLEALRSTPPTPAEEQLLSGNDLKRIQLHLDHEFYPFFVAMGITSILIAPAAVTLGD
jgi:hypothetical protein